MDGKEQAGPRLLLLLLSNLLLYKNVASQPICPNGAGCRVSLRELFDRAIILSHYIHSLSSEIFQEFDAQYSQGPGFFTQAISMCHTASISTPAGKEQAQQIQQKDFVILVIHLLGSWTEPLNHLITEARHLPKSPDALIAKAMEIQEQNQRLLEGLKKIGKLIAIKQSKSHTSHTRDLVSTSQDVADKCCLPYTVHKATKNLSLPGDGWPHISEGKTIEQQYLKEEHSSNASRDTCTEILVDPEIVDNGNYAVWLGLPSLQSSDLESLLFAYHNLFRCLRRDTHKVDNYLKFLKCKIAYDGSC